MNSPGHSGLFGFVPIAIAALVVLTGCSGSVSIQSDADISGADRPAQGGFPGVDMSSGAPAPTGGQSGVGTRSEEIEYVASLSGYSQRSPVATRASGTASLWLDRERRLLRYHI